MKGFVGNRRKSTPWPYLAHLYVPRHIHVIARANLTVCNSRKVGRQERLHQDNRGVTPFAIRCRDPYTHLAASQGRAPNWRAAGSSSSRKDPPRSSYHPSRRRNHNPESTGFANCRSGAERRASDDERVRTAGTSRMRGKLARNHSPCRATGRTTPSGRRTGLSCLIDEKERCGVRENCSLVGVSLMRTPNIIRFPRRRDCCDDLFRLSTNHQYYSPPATRETVETAHMH